MATPAPILVFDIETIPDVATGKRLYPELAGLSDNDAMTKLMALREQDVGHPFMPLPLHQIACLSVLWVAGGKMTLKQYHDAILHENSMPVEMLRVLLSNKSINRDYKPEWKFYTK